ncbi:39S ribosomal protein L53, mitochondrial-like [Anneissia japonica]|uniref:39S ribosomal protein L53, mitochondrial-like n=1 Tax=Anneissia japonica TaxID=1529436 RepID=UPI001425A184|nr:39S ribosomal protein L53, mitochondrial-like [Anneissia japonica]
MARSIIVKGTTLKFVKSIQVHFCPWQDDVHSARLFLMYMSSKSMLETNPNCAVTGVVKNNRSQPTIHIGFEDGKQLLFKSSNLTLHEMLKKLVSWTDEREKKEEASS